MKFQIEDLTVYFPYSYIYPEQFNYMVKLKQSLDAKGPVVLEMPSGTGKTVTLLSLITSYQIAHPEIGKLIYCSRTVAEIEKCLEEARQVLAYRDKELGLNAPKTLCIGLTARRNFCIHPRVSEEKSAMMADSKCRNITASWIRQQKKVDPSVETCSFYEGFEDSGRDTLLSGVYSINDIREYGKQHGYCPYFFARHLAAFANIIVFSYQYVIDPKVASLVSSEFKENAILVFDEAHNIDNVCIDALSVNINRHTLDASTRNINRLNTVIQEAKANDAEKLRREYNRLLEGLAQNNTNVNNNANMTDQLRASPVLTDDMIREAIPPNIRKGENFLQVIKRLVEFLKMKLRVNQAITETPISFLQSLYNTTQIEAKTLKFFSMRLNSLINNLELSDLDTFLPVAIVAEFASLVATYSKGFLLVIDPVDERTGLPEPSMEFSCLDASLALKPVLQKYRSTVITSGTLSPLDIYPRMLDFKPVCVERFPMTLVRNCVCPLIVSRGSDQVPISSKFDMRSDAAVVRNYGNLLVEMSAIVPDGMCCFFTSYTLMEETVSRWNEIGLLNQVLANKLLFVETPDPTETALALYNYKKACNSGRGAVLFAVSRGKVSEGIDFDNQYGRCVILFGIPYMNTESRVLKARLEFLRENYQIPENEFLTFDAMRTGAQCVGRVIRGKTDYGLMIFADKRYTRADKRAKLPKWISDCLPSSQVNLSTDMAVGIAKTFLREMSQPFPRDEQLGKSLWTLDHIHKNYVNPYQNRNNMDPSKSDGQLGNVL